MRRAILILMSLASINAVASDYSDDLVKFKNKIPEAKRETYLAAWRTREPNNPDSWILSANYYIEQADELDLNVAGNDLRDLIPKGKKETDVEVRMIDDDFYIFDKKTGERLGRMNIHSRVKPVQARKAADLLITARDKFPNRMDIHLGIAHAFSLLEAEEEKLQALAKMVSCAQTQTGKLKWCHDEPIGEDEEGFLVRQLHHQAKAYYDKQTAASDKQFHAIVELMVKACPHRAETWNDLALSCSLKEDGPGVQKALLKASDVSPEDSLVLFNIATNGLKLGLRSDAIAALKKIIALNNDPELVESAKAKLAELEDKPSKKK